MEIFKILDKYFIVEKSNINDHLGHDRQTFLNSIKENYNLFVFPEDNNEMKKINKEKVNGIFYKLGETICFVITNINNIDINNIDLKKFSSDLNEVTQIFTQFNCNLKLKLKGQFSLNTIIKCIEYFENNNKKEEDYIDLLTVLINNIFYEKNFMINKNFSGLKNILTEEKDIIINNGLPNELCMKIFIDKLLKYITNEDYKLEILKIFFSVPELIKYSSLFFTLIFLSNNISSLIKPIIFDPRRLNNDNEKKLIKLFGEIKNKDNVKILVEINRESENNEILKEILIYIFEINLISYFEDIQKRDFIIQNPKLLLTSLNFSYFKKAFDDINNNNHGKLKNISILYLFSYIRCFLYYFVKYQLNDNNENMNLNEIHAYLYSKSNSNLGKMIILYITKLFGLFDKQNYFFNQYSIEIENNNWKQSMISQNENLLFFPLKNFEK